MFKFNNYICMIQLILTHKLTQFLNYTIKLIRLIIN
nr:MAG TPA: hypothetical protein [Caudoviricetes sp.]